MALTVLSDYAKGIPGVAAVAISKGQLLAYGVGANAKKFVLFTADHTQTATTDPVGFADTDAAIGECVTAINNAVMGDDGSGTNTAITGTPGHYLFGGMTPGACQATAEVASTDLVCVVGQFVDEMSSTASTTHKFVIRLMPAMLSTGQPS